MITAWRIAITAFVLLLFASQVVDCANDAQTSERLARLEQMIRWEHREVGRLEEGCLRRDAAVSAWQESIRLRDQDSLDRALAWLGKALTHGD